MTAHDITLKTFAGGYDQVKAIDLAIRFTGELEGLQLRRALNALFVAARLHERDLAAREEMETHLAKQRQIHNTPH